MTREFGRVSDKSELFRYYWNALSEYPRPEPQPEYRFDAVRKWRFDWAFLDPFKIAVEVEGNAWNVPGGGKHMQDRDMEKYNAAAAQGWRIMRFSPGMLKRDPLGCVEIVRKALGL